MRRAHQSPIFVNFESPEKRALKAIPRNNISSQIGAKTTIVKIKAKSPIIVFQNHIFCRAPCKSSLAAGTAASHPYINTLNSRALNTHQIMICESLVLVSQIASLLSPFAKIKTRAIESTIIRIFASISPTNKSLV